MADNTQTEGLLHLALCKRRFPQTVERRNWTVWAAEAVRDGATSREAKGHGAGSAGGLQPLTTTLKKQPCLYFMIACRTFCTRLKQAAHCRLHF